MGHSAGAVAGQYSVLMENVTGTSPKCPYMVTLVTFPVTFFTRTRTDRAAERPIGYFLSLCMHTQMVVSFPVVLPRK